MSVKKFKFVSPGIFIDEIDNSQVPAVAAAMGPTIVGRSERGPAMRPVRVESFSEFVNIFGNPISGKGSLRDDTWRDGNYLAPTYGVYAAQAYLKNNGPITFVRLLGDQSPNKNAGAGQNPAPAAGWQAGDGGGPIGAAGGAAAGYGGAAFGLFIFDNPAGAAAAPTGGGVPDHGMGASGTLAATWYLNDGCILLTGSAAAGARTLVGVSGTCGLIRASGPSKEFEALIQDTSGNEILRTTFNFNDSSAKYIRKAFNTNPTLTNSDLTPSDTLVNYWLGESFDRNVADRVTGSSADNVVGAILPLYASGSSLDGGDYLQTFQAAQSGWVFSQDTSTSGSGYAPMDSSRVSNLFKFHSLGVGTGDWDQKNLKISIQDIKAPTNLDNPYGTFSVVVRKAQDSDNAVQIVERFSDCNLNPNSLNYVGRKVGDRYVTWVEADRAYQEYGTYDNLSKFVRLEMHTDVNAGTADSALVPFGFFGPTQYRAVTLYSGSTPLLASGSWPGTGFILPVTGGAQVVSSSVTVHPGPFSQQFISASVSSSLTLQFPSITMRASSLNGGLSNQTDAYFGLTTGYSTTSTRFDYSYQDVVRTKPVDANGQNFAIGGSTRNVAFTMDDLVYDTGTDAMTYTSGSRAAETSCTHLTGAYTAVLDRGYDRFTLPLFGGFNGVRIDEKDPFRNEGFPDSASDVSSYMYYSVKKGLDTVADPEVVETNMLSMPGLTYESLTSHVLNICEERADALGVIDLLGTYVPSTENTSDEATRLGNISTTISNLKSRGLNTSYGCAYYPWVQVRDNINGAVLWVPPSVPAIGTLGSSAANSEIWFAPAGFNRGGLTEGSAGLPVLNVRQRLTSKNRDDLYEANINPIASFPSEGIVMFGQKTLQVTPSALDRINVRRLLIFLKKEISRISSTMLFDQNVQSTWDKFLGQVLPFLGSVKNRLGLADYKVILDESTTTPDLIDRNIMYAKIFLKPAKAIEFIALDFVITDSGASFED
jgi:hypothetical protein